MSKISSPQVDKWKNKSPPLRADMIYLNLLHCNVMTKTIWLASLSVFACFEISLSLFCFFFCERGPPIFSLSPYVQMPLHLKPDCSFFISPSSAMTSTSLGPSMLLSYGSSSREFHDLRFRLISGPRVRVPSFRRFRIHCVSKVCSDFFFGLCNFAFGHLLGIDKQ